MTSSNLIAGRLDCVPSSRLNSDLAPPHFSFITVLTSLAQTVGLPSGIVMQKN